MTPAHDPITRLDRTYKGDGLATRACEITRERTTRELKRVLAGRDAEARIYDTAHVAREQASAAAFLLAADAAASQAQSMVNLFGCHVHRAGTMTGAMRDDATAILARLERAAADLRRHIADYAPPAVVRHLQAAE